jgi:hypothetical protein
VEKSQANELELLFSRLSLITLSDPANNEDGLEGEGRERLHAMHFL